LLSPAPISYVKECEHAAAKARIMVAQTARVAYENTLRYSASISWGH
jgi:hypothetical protein